MAAALCNAQTKDALIVRLASLLNVLSSPEMLTFTVAFFHAIEHRELELKLAQHVPVQVDPCLFEEAYLDFVPLLTQIHSPGLIGNHEDFLGDLPLYHFP